MRRRKCGIGGLPIQLIGVRTRVDDRRSSRAKPPFSHCQFDQAWNFSRLRSCKLPKHAQAHKQRADKSWVGTYYIVWWEWWEKLDSLWQWRGDSSIFAALYNWVFLFRRCCSPGYVKLGTLEWSGTFRWWNGD